MTLASVLAPGRARNQSSEPGLSSERFGRGHRVTERPVPKIVRHSLIAFGSVLWFAGLWAQFHSLSAIGTYVVLSLLMVVVVAF